MDQHAFGPRLAGAGREEKSVDGVWEKVVSSSESGFYKTSVFEATVWGADEFNMKNGRQVRKGSADRGRQFAEF